MNMTAVGRAAVLSRFMWVGAAVGVIVVVVRA